MLARPARRATYHRALRSGELIPQNEWELRRSEGSGKLIDDPLVEGSNAGSTNRASDLSQSSGGRRNSDAQTGAACS